MIETKSLLELEGMFRRWYEERINCSDGIALYLKDTEIDINVPDFKFWEEFSNSLYYADSDDSYIEKEMTNNALHFNRDGIEYSYMQRIDNLYGNIETAIRQPNREVRNFYETKDILNPTLKEWQFQLGKAGMEFHQLLFVLTRGAQVSYYVSEFPEKFPHIGPIVKMFHESKTQFAKDPSSGSRTYIKNETGEWVTHQPVKDVKPQSENGVKLKFKCSPAIAGYLISELIRQDYIEVPLRHGNINMTELGRICSQIFDLPEKFKTNAEGWRKVLDVDSLTGNQLTAIKRAKLELPPRTDLE